MRDRRPATLLALALVSFGAVLGVALALPAGGVANRVKTLGRTEHTPNPACPEDTDVNPCEAIGRVTGFQVKADGRSGLFRAPEDGKLVAWAIEPSKPNKAQRDFFGGLFGTSKLGNDPFARIAVLKKIEGHQFKLMRQGPRLNLTDSLGLKQYVTLNDPLRIAKDQILALTVPTWSSSFANKLTSGSQWRGSRTKDNCAPDSSSAHDVNQFVRNSKPQQNKGSVRHYGCEYTTARLLYWGYYIPS